MAANDLEEIEMDGSDSPLKQEDCPKLVSPVFYDSVRSQLQGATEHNCIDTFGSNDSEQFGMRISGLELSYVASAGPQSPAQTGHVGNNLKFENNKDYVLDVSNFSSSKDADLKKGHWPHLSQMVAGPRNTIPRRDSLSRAKDKLMVSIKENSRKDDIDAWNMRNLKAKHVDETGRVCSNVLHGKNLNTESALLPQDARLRILSTSSFSQFFGKKTAKGKGVIDGRLGDEINLDNDGLDGNFESYGRRLATSGMTSEDQIQPLLRCSSGIANHDGVDLREWLKPGHRVKNKAESLNFFKQIAELVNSAHSQGVVLQQLRPSYLVITPSNELNYIGSSTQMELHVPKSFAGCKKRLPGEDISAFCTSDLKQQKVVKVHSHAFSASLVTGVRNATVRETKYDIGSSSVSYYPNNRTLSMMSHGVTGLEKSPLTNLQLEEKWYTCPEELNENDCKVSSNIYNLGVLLFELLCSFDSLDTHCAAMFDMQRRILPPFFLSENPKEAGFCLWLIHPNPSSRPTIREVLHSDLFSGSQELNVSDELAVFTDDVNMAESELLLDFIVSLKEKKQDHAMKLVEDIRCIETDIKGLLGKPSSRASPLCAKRDYNLQDFIKSITRSGSIEDRLRDDMSQLEKAYFLLRNQTTSKAGAGREDRDLLKKRETWSQMQKQNDLVNINQESACGLDVFFEGLCKFTCYSKFELRGTLRNGDLLNSANVICSLSFDRDEEYIAVAGASKKIKIFEYSALVNDTIDIHYPVIEIGNKSKLSCISWNSYIRNYLASTDYDGVVQVWDASTGVSYSQHTEHQKRAWSIDFSRIDPTMYASGSDDCSVKLWSTNEKRSTCTIWSPANVCCVQFSPYSSHLLMFGSADHKIYGYDLRHMRIPWCTLAGHEKTVSYVKFMDSGTLVSASTDNTLKLWDLNKTSLSGMSSDACHLTFGGHINKKHFVGLAVSDGYIACGSESNEVFTYYKSLPMPITSYKLSSINPLSQHEVREDDGLFVSSVCWRSKSNTVLAANSSGSIRLLQLV
ncbi:protein SUPPRESSOR OF PHYA-105 1-like isoform X1 [Chenopodium quinoa]|uniref:Protein kinase domain-containing protein n=2 Tax=Chenopodium quinoa TaxID=63459 RepID=A0A803KZJ4_CHEQI|nr:protein SUPPRESSOR OF PHYA-105 1-like isoform X1 [Chenopodium quinoa]